ncbi:flagellar basal body P-ring protein FlgI [Marinobacter xestospongiae]|nr:flagellar basal body P-ring protein FlgI [Marinobacter xestospongiae]
MRFAMRTLLSCLLLLLTLSAEARSLMDLVDVKGLRQNQLIGYGLVVGLTGTGDRNQVRFTSQSMTNMLKQFGVQLPENVDPKLRNVAAVSVHATLSSVASSGQTLDVTVSSIGDASSLQGGTLLLTPLHGVDGEIYAVAQGNLVVGGLGARGRDGSSVQVNIPTVGIIPEGAIIEQEVPVQEQLPQQVTLTLKAPHYRTARNVELAINRVFGPGVAAAQDSGRIHVNAPVQPDQRVVFMSMLEDINVEEGRNRPRVVFNSRTGTLVMGQGVKVHKSAVSHGNLTVTISEDTNVSQPRAFGNGRTVATPDSRINVEQERPHMFVWPEGTDLDTIVRAVNSLGAAPSDIMSILQALDEAGALEGDLVVI